MISEPARLLFAYGTLQRGGIWHHLLAWEEFVGRDTVTGGLYLHPCGVYPVLLPGDRAVPERCSGLDPRRSSGSPASRTASTRPATR